MEKFESKWTERPKDKGSDRLQELEEDTGLPVHTLEQTWQTHLTTEKNRYIWR